MLNKKEIFFVLITVLAVSLLVYLVNPTEFLPLIFLGVLCVFAVNVSAKKVAAFYLDSDVEVKMLEIVQYGFKPQKRFKTPVPLGAFVFEVRPEIHKAARKRGLYKFSEVTESQTGAIAAAGILANLFFALGIYLAGFHQFAVYNVYYAFFNMIPLFSLDGNKIFYGSRVLSLPLGEKQVSVPVLWIVMSIIVSASFFLTFFI